MGLLSSKKKKKPAVEPPKVGAVIAAAGSGTRMGPDYPEGKQLITVGDYPVLAYTLNAFEQASSINEVVVAAREEDIVPISELVKDFGFNKVKVIIRGGDTRQQSVSIAITQLSENIEYVAIHDGARPFVRPERIDQTVAAAVQHGAAVLGVRLVDTVKKANHEGIITGTVDRNLLWAVQTPQVFRLQDYKVALAVAAANGKDYTDDSQLFESRGRPVRMVEGDRDNIKITTPDDLLLAELIAERTGLINADWTRL